MTKKKHPLQLSSIMDLFDVGPAAAFTVLLAAALILTAALVFFVRSAPPTEITLTAGPEGGSFQRTAVKYAKILEENGVKLKVLTSHGSTENLKRLKDPASRVDVGLVQSGLDVTGTDGLVSLGSISQQPLLVFYRGKPFEFLSGLKGRKIAIGPEGSGANQLSRTLLAANGMQEGSGTTLLTFEPQEAAAELEAGKIDAAFIMSESASFEILKSLMHAPQIHLYSFRQASGYDRKYDYLQTLTLPMGIIDFGANLPSQDVSLIGPSIDLIATKDLHPALSDLLLEAATQVHSRPGFFQQRGEFPAPLEHGIRISDDAARYYKSGKSFFYRYLPFWLASLLSRLLVVFVPALVILIPAVKTILAFFRWKVKTKIYQRYRELVWLERAVLAEKDPSRQEALRRNFDRIEEAVYKMRVKGSYADQVYGLREHIDYVRRIVERRREEARRSSPSEPSGQPLPT